MGNICVFNWKGGEGITFSPVVLSLGSACCWQDYYHTLCDCSLSLSLHQSVCVTCLSWPPPSTSSTASVNLHQNSRKCRPWLPLLILRADCTDGFPLCCIAFDLTLCYPHYSLLGSARLWAQNKPFTLNQGVFFSASFFISGSYLRWRFKNLSVVDTSWDGLEKTGKCRVQTLRGRWIGCWADNLLCKHRPTWESI